MAKLLIPYNFLPQRLIIRLARQLKLTGSLISNFFPQLGEDMFHAKIDVAPKEYCAISFSSALLNAALLIAIIDIIAAITGGIILAYYALALGALFGIISFFTAITYPKLIAMKRAREIDKEMIPAIRQLLIELRSGVPLFNALVSLTSDYGELSKEFTTIIEKIDAGIPETDAISEATYKSPSISFKKTFWQISNSLKTGGDISNGLEAVLKELTHEKIETIRKYSQELSPWMMIYMMTAVIMPSLGTTMLIIISKFLAADLSPLLLWVITGALAGFQLFFLNFLTTRYPAV